MTSPERRLLILLESAQAKLGEALELIATTPDLEERYRDEGRKLAELILRFQKISDDITAEEGRKSA